MFRIFKQRPKELSMESTVWLSCLVIYPLALRGSPGSEGICLCICISVCLRTYYTMNHYRLSPIWLNKTILMYIKKMFLNLTLYLQPYLLFYNTTDQLWKLNHSLRSIWYCMSTNVYITWSITIHTLNNTQSVGQEQQHFGN